MVPQHSIQLLEGIVEGCRKSKKHSHLLRVHGYLHKHGLEGHVLLGNHLVTVLVEARKLDCARVTFDMLLYRKEYSWTSLITGYVKHGKPHYALCLYECMKTNADIQPIGHTFVALLKACAKVKCLQKGLEIHSDIDKLGLDKKDVFIGSALIDMYSKCGSILRAQEVFDNLKSRNVVCWNTLILAHIESGYCQNALSCFAKMQRDGICPDYVTYICVLKACSCIQAIDEGMKVHSELERQGLFHCNGKVGNALLDMYGKCGLPSLANEVFNRLPSRDVVSWTSIIAAYVDKGDAHRALFYFDQMRSNAVYANAVTYICCIKACGILNGLSKGEALHRDIKRDDNLRSNPVIGNALIDMYMKCGELTKAREVFDELTVKDVAAWSSLITGYTEKGHAVEILDCLKQIEFQGVIADTTLLISMLKACIKLRATERAYSIYAEIERKGLLGTNSLLGNIIVDMYSKFGYILKSQQIFNRLPARDLVSWNVLMAAYTDLGLAEQTANCLEKMRVEGVSPDAISFVCALKAHGIMGAIDKGTELHGEIERQGLLVKDSLVGSSLVDMYARCGALPKALEVFHKLPSRDVVSWTAVMEGYAQLGESENVFHAFNSMLAEHILPDPVTFIVILNVCSHTGLFIKGQTYFEVMSKAFGITPIISHHNCLVDTFVRLGHLDKMPRIFERVPFRPDSVSQRTILSACCKWGGFEHAQNAFKHASL
ncbi:hypothetical protein KP509_23G019700 [Ceratopteris richardii]|uniref:Pentatricopeptide repeat-containing protein n=1 Tax=Ceratopteris richardii TaxID=49495 RepID=A0A8T2RYB3_CERRI|nr:hypothetical protein KP509_23G019700 [Ceratopteris richardii]KAH7301312.1 hypothetical protein KP509_23G019700 [Ceratopteris richardii]KAH7301313.1 hypothetical protein KP509_23G019700 [Ceratopteris richardii]